MPDTAPHRPAVTLAKIAAGWRLTADAYEMRAGQLTSDRAKMERAQAAVLRSTATVITEIAEAWRTKAAGLQARATACEDPDAALFMLAKARQIAELTGLGPEPAGPPTPAREPEPETAR